MPKRRQKIISPPPGYTDRSKCSNGISEKCKMRYLLSTLVFSAGLMPIVAAEDKPYGLDKRIAWTTSKVVGSPDPALPYQIEQTFTKLKIPCPIAVAREPGTDNL